jgi:hypothetical protein
MIVATITLQQWHCFCCYGNYYRIEEEGEDEDEEEAQS